MRQSVRRRIAAAGAAAAVCGGVLSQAVGGALPAQAASASQPAAYAPPRHDLFYGNKGAAVRSVQRRLSALHYYGGPVDGVYGYQPLPGKKDDARVRALMLAVRRTPMPPKKRGTR